MARRQEWPKHQAPRAEKSSSVFKKFHLFNVRLFVSSPITTTNVTSNNRLTLTNSWIFSICLLIFPFPVSSPVHPHSTHCPQSTRHTTTRKVAVLAVVPVVPVAACFGRPPTLIAIPLPSCYSTPLARPTQTQLVLATDDDS